MHATYNVRATREEDPDPHWMGKGSDPDQDPNPHCSGKGSDPDPGSVWQYLFMHFTILLKCVNVRHKIYINYFPEYKIRRKGFIIYVYFKLL